MSLRVLNKDILNFFCPWSVIFSVELIFNSVLALSIQQNVQLYIHIYYQQLFHYRLLQGF